MRIAIDARIINSSTGRYVERLLTYLEKIDTVNDYLVLVRAKDKTYWQPTSKNFTIQIADFEDYSFSEQLGLKRLLDELKPDLVHFCMPQQPILYQGPHVTTFHDLTLLRTYNSDKNWLVFHAKQLVARFVFRRVAHSSIRIITPSTYTKKALVKFAGISPQKVTVSYEGADTAQSADHAFDLPNGRFLLYVGQQSDYKNIWRLIEAHQRLRLNHPDLLLVLVGKKTTMHRRHEARVQEAGYEGVIFTDFVDDNQLAWLYRHAALYVFPSLMEGFGLPGLEAMSYGCPLVSSKATCLPEVYRDGAIYFDPTNVTDMSKTIETVLTDPQLRQALIKRGDVVATLYSWERMAKETHAVYVQAIESVTSSPGR